MRKSVFSLNELLSPDGKTKSYNEIGRAMATLMVDDLFSDVAYKARDREDLIAGIDEFLDEVIVLPPGEWDPKIRIEPPKKLPSAEMRKSVFSLNELEQPNGNLEVQRLQKKRTFQLLMN
ncbi:electrogenic sodium bicarbonate cotransporter 4-like [Carassius auratus]|uniref:Electrogenic sodium bicarbonate cotransporter 4-like n=1 Tax=Carassius auratus TaxID=7957 RepID=A0A6P6KV19_CARAU|nr:electrogenic sodium bicarbonate cotransporter 4-like [Carassius auratus]